MPENLSCVILVGGVEHRISGGVPRALQSLSGVPIVGHVLKAAESMGIKKITVVSNAKGLEKYLGNRAVHIWREGSKGSGDALFAAKKQIEDFSGDTLVVYGDRPLIKKATLERLVNAGRKSGLDCAFLTVVMGDAHGHARIIRNPDGEVGRTGRDCEIPTEERKIREVIGGAYYFRRGAIIEAFKEMAPENAVQYYLTDMTTWFAERKQVLTISVADPDESRGIYSFKDLADAEKIMQERIMDHWMSEGVRIVDPRTTSIGAEAVIGRGTVINQNTIIEGPCIIGEDCALGPFARVRAGVHLGGGVRLGTFVEVVRSRIGDKTRIMHLAFIGDAEIAANVMIGAGAITANSDGYSSHKTVIEREARIGSGTILVAPVKVGSGATTGSGAVVTKNHDVPDGETVVGVPAKAIKRGMPEERLSRSQ